MTTTSPRPGFRPMDSRGYSHPHSCHLCQEVYLDFSTKDPWEILQPLHKSMENWSTERQNAVPSWILPLSIRAVPRSRETFGLTKFKRSLRRIQQVGSKNTLNVRYRTAVLENESLRVEASKWLNEMRFFDITFEECTRRANTGCKFFQTLIHGPAWNPPWTKLRPGDMDCVLGIHGSRDENPIWSTSV